jgi:hypothetical protein
VCALLVVDRHPLIEVSLQGIRRIVNLLAEGLPVEFVEQRLVEPLADAVGQAYADCPDIRRFFQLFTPAWAVYFVLKAALYLLIGKLLPLPEALAIRAAVGGVSLGLMVALSVTQGPRLFRLCRVLHLTARPARHVPVPQLSVTRSGDGI